MGYFSNMQVEEQNPRERFASGGEVSGPSSDLIPVISDSGYLLPKSDVHKFAPVLARINAGWHEGEGCSGNACCCDQIELDIE